MRVNNDFSDDVTTVHGTDDREARQKFWIAAYTKSKGEKKASEEISKMLRVETYTPVQTRIRQWSDRKKKVDFVVIPMVIFAQVSSEEEILSIKKHPLVYSVAAFPGERSAAKIPTSQIEKLKFMLGQSDIPVTVTEKPFRTGDMVQVVRGGLQGLKGEVKELKPGKNELVVEIALFGCAKLTIDSSSLELLSN